MNRFKWAFFSFFIWISFQSVDAMAAKIRVVNFQVAASTSTGTLDITDSDLSDVQLAFVFLSGATANDLTNLADTIISAGVVDDTGDDYTISGYSDDHATNSNAARKQSTTNVIEVINDTAVQGRMTYGSMLSNGLRLNYTSDTFDAAYRGIAILWEGLSDWDINNTVNLHNGSVSGISKPDLVFAMGTTGGTTLSSDMKFYFGCACRDPSDDSVQGEWASAFFSDDSTIADLSHGVMPDTFFLRNTTSTGWYDRYFFDTFDATGYSFGASANSFSLTGPVVVAITLPSGQQALCGSGNFPTTGDLDITTNYNSGDDDSELFFIVSGQTARWSTISDPSRNDAGSFGAVDSQGNKGCIALVNDDNAAQGEGHSAYSNTDLIYNATAGTPTVTDQWDSTSLTGGDVSLTATTQTGGDGYAWFSIQAADVGLIVAPTAVTESETLPAPTVDPGAVYVALNTVSEAEIIHQPTITTSVPIALTVVTESETLPNPGVVPGAAAISVNIVSETDSLPNPALAPGQVAIGLEAVSAIDTVAQPAVSQGLTISPSIVSETDSLPNLAVSTGPVTVSPTITSEVATIPNPSIDIGSVTISPNVVSETDTIHEIALSPGAVTIIPGLIEPSDTLPAPIIAQDALVIAPTVTSETATFPTPAVIGAQQIIAQIVSASDSLPNPAVVPGLVTISTDIVAESETLPGPSLQILITPESVAAATTIPAGTIVQGAATISPEVTSTAATFPLSVILGGAVADMIRAMVSADPTLDIVITATPATEIMVTMQVTD